MTNEKREQIEQLCKAYREQLETATGTTVDYLHGALDALEDAMNTLGYEFDDDYHLVEMEMNFWN